LVLVRRQSLEVLARGGDTDVEFAGGIVGTGDDQVSENVPHLRRGVGRGVGYD